MDKTLNDYVDGFFRGVVYVVLDYFRTLLILIARPWSGFRRVLVRLRSKNTDQVRPHLFLFLSLFLVLSLVPAFEVLDQARRNTAFDPNGGNSFASRLFALGTTAFDSSHLLPTIATCFGMVIVIDLAARLGSMAMPNRARGRLFADAAFFILGLQAVLLIVVGALVGWKSVIGLGEDRSTAIARILSLPADVIRGSAFEIGEFGRGGLLALAAGVVLIGLIPFPMLFRFAARVRDKRRVLAVSTIALIVFDYVGMRVLMAGGYAADQIAYRDRFYFVMSDVECRLLLDATPRVEGIVTVRNVSSDVWRLAPDDFTIVLYANPAESDRKVYGRRSGKLLPAKRKLSKTMVVGGTLGNAPEVLFLEPGGNFWLRIAAQLDNDDVQFVKTHHENRQCEIAYDHTDMPIAATGDLPEADAGDG
jgi:hypothetical protein